MAQERCIHGMLITVPISCSLCRQQRSRGSWGTLVAPPPEEMEEEPGIDGDPEDEEEKADGPRKEDEEYPDPAEAALAPGPPKPTRAPLAWDLRESDATPATILLPKVRKPSTRLLLPSISEEGETDKKPGLLMLGSDPITISQALARLMDNGKKNARQIAADFRVTDGCVSQYLSLRNLVPSVQRLMDPARPKSTRLYFTVAVALASLPAHLQEQCAQEVLAGDWTATQAAQYIRVQAKQARAAAKLSRPAG